ncbi:MAG: VacJ family lipoprotein [SAR116 cluster bacterium]|nr:MAG: VacJ family lipoprotein [SAR116 cluster bacterium]
MKVCPDNDCRRPRHIAIGALIAAMVALAGCSSTPPADRSDARDRYEDANRKVFAFNMGVDTYVLEPVASGYRNTVPEGGRTAIDNHLRWASMPSTAINSTLQGKFENAALATLNFLVNGLTLGFADLSEDDQKVDREDFGQTLAAYDVPEGSYLMVPVLGPRTTRSLTGTVVDMVMNPLQIFGTSSTADTVRTAQAPVGAVSFRAKTFEAFNDVKYNSLDPYARTRSVYYQTRLGLLEDRVADRAGSAVSEDEFDSLFEESE